MADSWGDRDVNVVFLRAQQLSDVSLLLAGFHLAQRSAGTNGGVFFTS
jgi:hypothetical protein